MLIKDLAELESEAKITHEDVDYFSPDELKAFSASEFLDELKQRKNATNEKVRSFRRAFKNQYKIALRNLGINITTVHNSQHIAETAMRMAAQEVMNSPGYIYGGIQGTTVMLHSDPDEADVSDGETGE